MRIPIVCVDERVRQYAGVFWECFTRPHRRHFVTMLVALLLCHGPRTLTNLFRTVAGAGRVASLSRFLAEAPWDASNVAKTWFRRFREQVAPQVAALHTEQRARRPRRRGRPKATRVTGYRIGDDSTIHKRRGKKMEGLGKHYSTTERRVLTGHSHVLLDSWYSAKRIWATAKARC